VGPDGVRLLQFGKTNAQGLKDVMGSINGFYQVVHRLARDGTLSEWTIVGDLPAGPRQAAYNWVPYANRLVLIVEPTWQSILTARRLTRIARARSGVEVVAFGNKLRETGDIELIEERLGERTAGWLPFDPLVAEADARGKALIDHAPDSPAVRAIEELVDVLDRRKVNA
jgi:MinD-like ATPase involved in chromosome partitioning or flagellar assembly